jgi:hypothetical protein
MAPAWVPSAAACAAHSAMEFMHWVSSNRSSVITAGSVRTKAVMSMAMRYMLITVLVATSNKTSSLRYE